RWASGAWREHRVLAAVPYHADVCPRHVPERGEELGVARRIRDHPLRTPDAASVDEPARATEQRTLRRELSIGDDGVVQRDEDVEYDRHATQSCEYREHQHVEPPWVHDQHDVTARRSEESPD